MWRLQQDERSAGSEPLRDDGTPDDVVEGGLPDLQEANAAAAAATLRSAS
jgi:hypothetical protein